jgi:hypothetical protein
MPFVDKATQQPRENLMILLTNYHGRFKGSWYAEDINSGVGVEVRYVRQTFGPPPG